MIISQGNVAARLRCGGKMNSNVANSLLREPCHTSNFESW